MKPIQKELKSLKDQIVNMKKELEQWEKHNQVDNDLLRDEIKSKQKQIKKLKTIQKTI